MIMMNFELFTFIFVIEVFQNSIIEIRTAHGERNLLLVLHMGLTTCSSTMNTTAAMITDARDALGM